MSTCNDLLDSFMYGMCDWNIQLRPLQSLHHSASATYGGPDGGPVGKKGRIKRETNRNTNEIWRTFNRSNVQFQQTVLILGKKRISQEKISFLTRKPTKVSEIPDKSTFIGVIMHLASCRLASVEYVPKIFHLLKNSILQHLFDNKTLASSGSPFTSKSQKI